MPSQQTLPMPKPDPALQKLKPLIGTWKLRGHLIGSREETITGEAVFQWLEGGFFLQQDIRLNFMGMPIISRELVSYDPKTNKFPSLVYSNMWPEPVPYTWDVQGEILTITVKHGMLDATFTGHINGDHTGAWAPNPGADLSANIAYELTSERVK